MMIIIIIIIIIIITIIIIVIIIIIIIPIKHDNVMDLMFKITGRNILIKDNVSVSS